MGTFSAITGRAEAAEFAPRNAAGQTADEAYQEVAAQVAAVLRELTVGDGERHSLLALHAAKQGRQRRDWGYVGDLSTVLHYLESARDSLRGE